ncbi:MAG: hypothetical protein PHY43_13760 [Verrucomicrobiales bacterium]|nr:hypothetical protein [Verrucomicrobiales bacterium]
MKKMILTGTVVLALAGASLQSARAGDREWATVGKVLTGVAVAGLIVAASDGHAQYSVNYSYSSPAYYPPCPPPPCNYNYCPPPAPRVVCCPPPVVYYAPSVAYYPARPVVYHPNRWLNHERWHEMHGR